MKIGSVHIGDLVSYTREENEPHPYVITGKKNDVGIVINVITHRIGDGDYGSIMETVIVMWSDFKWNGKLGYSEENSDDLVVIQSSHLCNT